MADLGDELQIKTLPIPTEQRLDVFIAGGPDPAAEARWLTQGGASTFHYAVAEVNAAATCGICLFSLDERIGIAPARWAEIEPFFVRGGEEANVFQWQPLENNFVRRDRDWVHLRVRH